MADAEKHTPPTAEQKAVLNACVDETARSVQLLQDEHGLVKDAVATIRTEIDAVVESMVAAFPSQKRAIADVLEGARVKLMSRCVEEDRAVRAEKRNP